MKIVSKTLALAAALTLAAPHLHAQTAFYAPIPTQLTSATTVFVANAGLDNGSSTRAYNTFYQGLAASKRFQIKPAPAAAELTFEISVNDKIAYVNDGTSSGFSYVRLVMRDTKTGALLWTLSENVRVSTRQKTFEANLDEAVTKLLVDLKDVTPNTSSATH
jgi:hypothetical protein